MTPVNSGTSRNTIYRGAPPLSALQLAIFNALPLHTAGSVLAGQVLDALRDGAAEFPTNAQRVSVSRALARFEKRGLVRCVGERRRPKVWRVA